MTWKTEGLMGVLAMSACVLGAPAMAQQGCEARAAAVYFEPGAATFNAASRAVIDRVVQEARACGVMRVVAEAPSNERGKAISDAFASQGVKVILGSKPKLTQGDAAQESIRDRSAMVRVDAGRARAG